MAFEQMGLVCKKKERNSLKSYISPNNRKKDSLSPETNPKALDLPLEEEQDDHPTHLGNHEEDTEGEVHKDSAVVGNPVAGHNYYTGHPEKSQNKM